MRFHSFDTDFAEKYGIFEAIFINHFQFWLNKNLLDKRHQYEGRTWTYGSVKSFERIFPYLSNKQIRNTLDSLRSQNVVLTGCFNENKYDRTLWYAFVDEDEFLLKKTTSNESNDKGEDNDKTDDSIGRKGNHHLPVGENVPYTDNITDNVFRQKDKKIEISSKQGGSGEALEAKPSKGVRGNPPPSSAPPPPSENFLKFLDWSKANGVERIWKMDSPLTSEQYEKIREEFGLGIKRNLDVFIETVLQMENKKTLLKDYKSTNLTLRNWLARRKNTDPTLLNPVNNTMPANEKRNISSTVRVYD